ncbi:hypothetical protein [Roseibium sp. MMSF_3412]|uniref:hypothetical protein n=1 Tax=Roseibium sp. MMSF_3412 TaxID=3046712 RepID=UPI00273D7211|nr:hypothetical protein [Roseibium sp. MMSF_3412]
MAGTFEDFLAALLAFESGWDRDRYDAGIIQDWQLDQWAGGGVETRFPQYTSWSQLTDAEWETMAYQSMNSLGFVGFQFGEALLIDLGYYDDTVFYGNGAATNTWDGTWTGKNGVTSLQDFTTKDAQTVAIQEAFGYNLEVLETQLAGSGQSLSDFIGQTASYTQNGQTVTVELTLTGILAAAHLRGAWGTASLLQGGAVSTDEYGTSILQYIDQFGGYSAPTIEQMIAFYEDRLTGDEGLGTPGETPGGTPCAGDPGSNGGAGVSESDADVVITWAWGQEEVVTGFDPANNTIFIDWIGAADLVVSETSEGAVFAVPANSQSTTLAGVQLSDLSSANFTILDATAAAKVLALVGDGPSVPDTPDTPDIPDEPDTPAEPDVPDEPDTPGEPDTPVTPVPPAAPDGWNGTAGVTAATASVVITWAWGTNRTISDFDHETDTIFIDWFGPEAIEMTEVGGNTVFTMASNNQTLTLAGVAPNDLSPANFTIMSDATGQEILSGVGSGPADPSGPVAPVDPDPTDPVDPGTPDGPQMIMIMPQSPSRVIDDFNPATDMLHLQAGIIAERLEFAAYPSTIADVSAGLTVRVLTPTGEIASETVLVGVDASDLTMNNFMVAEESALNEVAALLGQSVETPGAGGFDVVYDTDGSNPPVPAGASVLGGVKWPADFGADDIIGFDPAADEIDFGNASVHGLILTMTPAGEPVIDNPWGPDMQILQGVQLSELSIESFGIVGNEHLRQDLGGILSWETGVGPRDGDTVYLRSHEYGARNVIDGFDPAAQKISFLYFGTRERLSVEDTPEGMVISSLPSGQSFVFSGVSKSDLIPGNVEFHHDQVMEDNLEAPFGFDQNDVTLVSRSALLTPAAPPGATTDGDQVRDGVGAVTGAPETPDTPDAPDQPVVPPASDDDIVLQDGADTVLVTWDWGRKFAVKAFNPAEDSLNFSSLGASDVSLKETTEGLHITVENNGGHSLLLEGVQAEDLSAANLTAADWNTVVTDPGGVADQLESLGNSELLG